VTEKPLIGILQGHGEASLRGLQQAQSGLSVLYNVEEVTLNDTTPVPDRLRTLAIIDPKDSFPPSHLQQLDMFLAKGKNLLITYNRQTADLSQASGSSRHTGLEDWLAQKKIQISDQFVLDATCGNVNVQQPGIPFPIQIQFPYFPLVTKFDDHPVTKGLEQVVMRFPSPLSYTGDSSIRYTPLLRTSSKAGLQQPPVYFNVQKQWTQNDFPMQYIVLGAAFTGKLSGAANSKMVVISNGDFAVNGEGQQSMQQLPPDNVNLLVNSIDWLSDESGLIELRTKGVTSRPLEAIEDGSKTFYKYLNFLLPIFLIVGYGFARAQWKRNQKVRRMEEDYV
jgi:ABC-type uncharacterized transport system involved in gliding motility auxiliary subunit